MIQDIDRPDVNGVPPKMLAIRNSIALKVEGLTPYLSVSADDNMCSSVFIKGSHQAKEDWLYGIFHNSPYFIIRIAPKTRYYVEGMDVQVDLTSMGRGVPKLRKYTGPVDKVIDKVVTWLKVGVVQT